MQVTLVNLSIQFSRSHPVSLGVLYLASYLEKHDIPVEIRNYEDCRNSNPFSAETFTQFLEGSGDLIAISLMSSMMPLLLTGVKQLKKERPDCQVVAGGYGADAFPETLLNICPELDYVISGWGEKSLFDLVRALDNKHPIEDVAGLSYRQGEKIRTNVRLGNNLNIDALPFPAHHLLERKDRHVSLPIITARGCPQKCAFCDIPGFNNGRIVNRDIDMVLDEIEKFYSIYREDALQRRSAADNAEQGSASNIYPAVGIVDDTFCANRQRVLMFCDKMEKRGLNFKWRVSARVNQVDTVLLDRMAEAGCTAIYFGIESGSDRLLKEISKGFDSAAAIKAVQAATQRIELVTTSFIWGMPVETFSDFSESLILMTIFRAEGARTQAHLWAPLPRSRLYAEFQNELLFSKKFVSDIAFSKHTFLDIFEDTIRANPKLCSCFYHYPHDDLDKRMSQLSNFNLI